MNMNNHHSHYYNSPFTMKLNQIKFRAPTPNNYKSSIIHHHHHSQHNEKTQSRGISETIIQKNNLNKYMTPIMKQSNIKILKEQILSPNRECISIGIDNANKVKAKMNNYQSASSIANNTPWPLYYLPPNTKDNKKTLILDLDETLVHSAFKQLSFQADITLNVTVNQKTHQVHVLKRPYVDEFLQRMSKHFELVIFTASISQYANPLLNQLDRNQLITHRLFREHCINAKGLYIKDLNRLGRDLKDLIILDNNPVSYAVNKENGLPIKTWHWDRSDTELIKLIPLLKYLAYVNDVREFIVNGVYDNTINFDFANELINKSKQIKPQSINRDIEREISQCEYHRVKWKHMKHHRSKSIIQSENKNSSCIHSNARTTVNSPLITVMNQDDKSEYNKANHTNTNTNTNTILIKPYHRKTYSNINPLDAYNNPNEKRNGYESDYLLVKPCNINMNIVNNNYNNNSIVFFSNKKEHYNPFILPKRLKDNKRETKIHRRLNIENDTDDDLGLSNHNSRHQSKEQSRNIVNRNINNNMLSDYIYDDTYYRGNASLILSRDKSLKRVYSSVSPTPIGKGYYNDSHPNQKQEQVPIYLQKTNVNCNTNEHNQINNYQSYADDHNYKLRNANDKPHYIHHNSSINPLNKRNYFREGVSQLYY